MDPDHRVITRADCIYARNKLIELGGNSIVKQLACQWYNTTIRKHGSGITSHQVNTRSAMHNIH